MMELIEYIVSNPIVPYIRHADHAERKPWFMSERRLLDYLLIYIQEGQLSIEVEATVHLFRDDDFCLIQPNQLHTLQGITSTKTPYIHLDLFYNPLRTQSFMTGPGQTALAAYTHLLQPQLNSFAGIAIPVRFIPPYPSLFKESLLKLIDLHQQPDLLSQLEANQLANELVLSLLKKYSVNKSRKFPASHSLSWIKSYCSFHLSEPLSLADMAKRAGLSQSRFCAIFRQEFGIAPHQYLLQLRIEHAQELLRSTELSLFEIAEYCGFADAQHFSKVFKKAIGIAPGAYRRQL